MVYIVNGLIHVYCILYLVTLSLCCEKEYFERVDGNINMAPVLQSLSSVTMETCRRVCRLTFQCYHFNMLWDTTSVGTCKILALQKGALTTDTGGSYYCKYYFCILSVTRTK